MRSAAFFYLCCYHNLFKTFVKQFFLIKMKGILKIYHPDETLKYHLKSTYCKAVYHNENHLLEIEIISDDSLDHVDDDSLQYNFPQISLALLEYPVENAQLVGQKLQLDEDGDSYTEVDLFDDEEAYLSANELLFSENSNGDLELCWSGEITDFYKGTDDLIPFKLKCNFRPDLIEVAEE